MVQTNLWDHFKMFRHIRASIVIFDKGPEGPVPSAVGARCSHCGLGGIHDPLMNGKFQGICTRGGGRSVRIRR